MSSKTLYIVGGVLLAVMLVGIGVVIWAVSTINNAPPQYVYTAPPQETTQAQEATPPPETTTEPLIIPQYFTYVTTANLHLRQAPSVYAASYGIFPQGSTVLVIEYYNDDWFAVRTFDDQEGYMASEFLIRVISAQ